MPWDLVKSDFGGDETSNFGPRQESGTALYQIDTLATISSEDQDRVNVPNLVTTVLGDLACVAVEQHISVFKDCQHAITLGFDSVVDELDWSPDGCMLIAGDHNGRLHVVDAQTAETLFAMDIFPTSPTGKTFRRIVFQSRTDETFDLVVLGFNGQLMVLQNFNMNLFLSDEADIACAIKDRLVVKDTSEIHTEPVYDVVCCGDTFITMGSGETIIAVWVLEDGQLEIENDVSNILDNDAGILQGKLSSDGNYLFTLDTNRNLCMWATSLFIILKKWTESELEEFQLLETKDIQNNSLDGMKLVMLTTADEGQNTLMVLNLPEYETVYTLQLNTPSALAKCLTFQETLYVAECCADYSLRNNGVISMVRFRCLTETNPETRMYRFLQKNKFKEAENFAKLFQLDIELVHKVKANYLLDQLSPWNVHKHKDENVQEMISQLWNCLESVKDDLHVAEMCMREALPTMVDTEKLLSYCKKRLSMFSSNKAADISQKEKQQMLTTKIYSITHRLDTFRKAFGEVHYSGDKWDHFQKTDLLQEALHHLGQGSLHVCMTIWTRHEEEWEKILKPEIIHQLASQIPDRVKSAEILSFLRDHIIPSVARLLPEELALVVRWVLQKTVDMELLEKEEWPMNALQFLSSIYKGLCTATQINHTDATCTATDTVNKTKLNPEEVLEPVQKMITNLQHLYDLITKYNCKLTFELFMQETTETVTFRMLDKVVAIELIVPTLEKQIRPYMREHNLKEDLIFSKYVKDLLSRTGRVNYTWGAPTWEPKIIAVIACINDPEQKIEAILETMKWAPIPWNANIEKLVQSGLQLKHYNVSQLKKQCELMEVKKIVLKYKLKNIDIHEHDISERLMYYILSQDQPCCMEDALSVMKACKMTFEEELYIFRLRRLIIQEKLHECMDLLKSISSCLAVKCGRRLLNYIQVLLDDPIEFDIEESHKMKKNFTEAGIIICRFLLSLETNNVQILELQDLLSNLHNLWSLQVEYDKYLTLKQYEDGDYRVSIMVSFMKEFYNKRGGEEKTNYSKVYRLADILQISHVKLQGEIAIKAAKNGRIETAIKMCSKLIESDPTEETAETLYHVSLAFLNLQADTENDFIEPSQLRELPEITYKLACQALSLCSTELMSKCVELCKCAHLTLCVSNQCELGEYSFCIEGGLSDVGGVKPLDRYKDWKLDAVFKEDALVIKSTVALPLVAQYGISHPVLYEKKDGEEECTEEEAYLKSPVLRSSNFVLPVIQHLQDNSHILLAYQYAMHMVSTANQFTLLHDIGISLTDEGLPESVKLEMEYLKRVQENSQQRMKELVFNILMKIFNCNHVDHLLALTFLISRPKKESFLSLKKIISTSGHNYKKLKAVATVGLGLGLLYKEPNIISMCQQLETNASWGYKLSKYKISFRDAFQGCSSEKIKLLPLIVQAEAGDMALVKDFCSAFNLDKDKALMLYLAHVFATQHDITGDAMLNPLTNQLKKARMAIREIQKTDTLLQKLEDLYSQINSYDYETLEFLLEEMQRIEGNSKREKGLKLLGYLKAYTRTAEPSEYELRYRMDGDKEKLPIILDSLPVASKTRLPYHPFIEGDPWKIITPELCKNTVNTWLPIAKLLKISVDQIFIVSVQNMVHQHLATCKKSREGEGRAAMQDKSKWNWDVKDANLTLLDDVEQLLKNVSNCELAIACAKWMVTELPLGAEKVKGLEGCLRYAELWHSAIPNDKPQEKAKAQAAFLKFSSMWQRLATEQVLFVHKLAEPELLKLAKDAEKLLHKLYEHPSILEPDGVPNKPDIHETAEQIASINRIDLPHLLISMVDKWLPCSSSKDTDADSTMTFNFDSLKLAEESHLSSEDNDDENLKRVLYILKKGSREDSIVYLLNFAFKEQNTSDSTVLSHMCRVRALRCLLELRDYEAIQRLSQKTAEELRLLMRTLSYLVELEALHIQHSVQTFEECNKEGLVKGIWRNHNHQKSASFLVANLCLDYNLHDKQLWNSVLQQLHSFGLMNQLEYVLLRLGGFPDIWQVPSFPKTWYSVLMNPLTKVVPPLTEEQLDSCVHVFNLLNRCPVLHEIDMAGLSRQYQKLEMPLCALACLNMSKPIPGDKIKEYLTKEKISVLDNAKTLLKQGLDSTIVKEVKDLVFSFIIQEDDYSSIISHHYFMEFVGHCVVSDCVNGLLKFSIINNRIKDAERLFNLYCSHHPEVLNKLGRYIDDDDEEETPYVMLKAFLNMKNMSEVAGMIQ